MSRSLSNEKLKSDIVDEKNRKLLHGKEIWNILHTFSVYLNEDPTKKEIDEYKDFISGLLYFGTKLDDKWNETFKKYNEINPIANINNRNDAILWNCKYHNYVNIKLEKDLYECNLENISKRWGNSGNILKQNNTDSNSSSKNYL